MSLLNFERSDVDIRNLPLVSVHMITYGHDKYIRKAVESVLMQQTNFDYELIISNDNTKGETDLIIRELLSVHPKKHCIKYFPQEKNLGMMANSIFALNQCSGKYVAVCEGDDYWIDPLKLQKQVDILETNSGYSMVFTLRNILIEESGVEYLDDYGKVGKKALFTSKDIIRGFIPGSQTILMRNFRSITEYLTDTPKFFYADRYLAHFCSLFGDIFLLHDVTAVYRITGSGAWSSNNGLEKLHKHYAFMSEFHNAIGLPENNEILAVVGFQTSLITFKYCLKRPMMFKNKTYRKIIVSPFKKFTTMNRLKILLKVLTRSKS